MRPLRASLFSTLLCLFTTATFAQYTAKSVNFKNAAPYTTTDLQAVSGLHPGQSFSQDGLQAAAQKLIDTGAFDDVQVALDGPVKTIAVNFTLKPADPSHILKVSFANLIWWQPEELQSALHAKLPIFNGTLPEAGNQQDAAQAALEQLLTEKGISATLTHSVLEPSLTQPLRLLEYRIIAPGIRLHSANISGVSAPFAPAIDKMVAISTGTAYNEGFSDRSFTEHILNVYRDAGNLDASLTQLHRVPKSSSPTTIEVDLTATIQEDQPYRISTIDFAGTPLMTAATFTQSLTLHPEDIASRKALLTSLKSLNDAYRNQGYLDVDVDAVPTLDHATRHVAYTISVDPGAQYHVRNIDIVGLTLEQRKEFDSAWKLKPGDILNQGYAETFLQKNTALRSLAEYSAAFKITSDPKTHLSDITITFFKGAAPTTK
jgi:outer membrane protein assembly factor BamA